MNTITNTGIEQVFLAEIMIDSRILEDPRITSDLFTHHMNRKLYDRIRWLYAQNHPVSAHEVELSCDSPELRAYAVIVSGMTFTAVSAEFHLAELVKCRDLRRCSDAARLIEDSIRDGLDPEEIADAGSRALSGVGDDAACEYSSMAESLPKYINFMEAAFKRRGAMSGIASGIPGFDTLSDGFQPGELVIIGARPSVGKTALALNLVLSALKAGFHAGLFSLEMPQNQIFNRFAAHVGRIDAMRLRRGFLSQEELSSFAHAMNTLSSLPLSINDRPNIGIDALRLEARAMKRRDKIQILFVDYLGLITHPDRRMQRWEQVSEISRALKGLARELQVPIVALSQLTRDSEGNEPTIASLRDSGSIEQDADVIALLHTLSREGADPLPVELIAAKNRNGLVGRVHLSFDRKYQRFSEAE